MKDIVIKKYIPMTETAFYILFCLQKPQHGYGISQKVKEMTNGKIIIGPGTMYGSLSKMESDGLISFYSEEGKRKLFIITDLGMEVLEKEIARIEMLYMNSRREI